MTEFPAKKVLHEKVLPLIQKENSLMSDSSLTRLNLHIVLMSVPLVINLDPANNYTEYYTRSL